MVAQYCKSELVVLEHLADKGVGIYTTGGYDYCDSGKVVQEVVA